MDSVQGTSRNIIKTFKVTNEHVDIDAEDDLVNNFSDDSIESSDESLNDDECENHTSRPKWIDVGVHSETLPTSLSSEVLHQETSRDSNVLSDESSTNRWFNRSNFQFTKRNQFYGKLHGMKPIHYFNVFFDEEFLLMICDATNDYAIELQSEPGTEAGFRLQDWAMLSLRELKVFLGLLFHMGGINLDNIRSYWQIGRLFYSNIFDKHMTFNRFLLIMRCLHFTSEFYTKNPLEKIQRVVDHFNNKMNTIYYPSRELLLEAGLTLTNRRVQYDGSRKPRVGIRLYSLTEPGGLVLKLHLHIGSSKTIQPEDVAMKLLAEKLNAGHAVYMDPWYSSFALSKKLLDNKTYSTGILGSDLKDVPNDLIHKSAKTGENIFNFKQGVHVGIWKNDEDCVAFLTTEHESKMVQVLNTVKPEAIARYHDYMMKVDREKLLLSYYPCEKKAMRWYIKTAIHIFQLMLVNSFILYNRYAGERNKTFYDYRVFVVNSLLPRQEEENICLKTFRCEWTDTVHHLRKFERYMTGSQQRRRKMCKMCYKVGKRIQTMWYCGDCDKQPGLCPTCFNEYHEKHL